MRAAFAALARPLAGADGSAQLLPAGEFAAEDGRPGNLPGLATTWRLGAERARDIAAAFAARGAELPVDYEHQTLRAEANGQPAPAAGWIESLEWREGEGLFAAVRWTAAAAAAIAAGEYRFISPVFAYDPDTGEALELRHAGLTNTPAIAGMAEVALAAARLAAPSTGETRMTDAATQPGAEAPPATMALTAARLALLGLPAKAGDAEAGEALAALAARAATSDPAGHVPLAAFEAVKAELAALRKAFAEREVAEAVAAALDSGRLLPAQREWAEELGRADIGQLRGYIEKTPAIAALSGMQTGGQAPPGAAGALDEVDLAVCKAGGIDPKCYLEARDGASPSQVVA